MPFAEGFNFRSTLAFVTDGTDQQFVGVGSTYPTVSGGVTFGWVASTGLNGRDRDNTSDPRLAGGIFISGAATQDFRVDLPAAGDYVIDLACGDSASFANTTLELFDDTASLGKLLNNASQSPDVAYFDATGVKRIGRAGWIADHATITKTFGSTTLKLRLGGSSSANSFLNHLNIVAAAGGGTTFQPAWAFNASRLISGGVGVS